MKKAIIAIATFMLTGIMCFGCFDYTYNIKMENGDCFIVDCDSWGESYIIINSEHNFWNAIKDFESEKDLSLLCDTDYFRCYKLQNKSVNMYICGLKPDGDYFPIDPDEKVTPEFFKEKYGEDFKKVFLADTYIMKITLYYMGGCYHSTMLNIAEKLIAKDYEGLEKFGLTQEMINDKESLKEKTKIMYDYLDRSKGVYKNERFAS